MRFQGFQLPDSILFFCIVFFFIIIGVYYALKDALVKKKDAGTKETRTNKLRDFLTAYSTHSVIGAGMSLFSTYVSPSTLIGTPSSVYYRGTQYAVQVFVYILSIIFANMIFVPVFYKLKLKSTLEYLEGRFDERMRVVSVIVYSVNSLLTMASWLFIPAYALQRVTELDFGWTVFFAGAVGTFYTSFGGMRAVMSADLIQTLIMVFSLLSVIVKGTSVLGGLGNVININKQHKRIYFDDMDPNPFTYKVTFWTVVVGGTFYQSMIYSTYQPVITRYMPAATLSKAKTVLWMQIPLMSAMYLISCFAGVVVFAYYYDCDPFLVHRIKRIEELMPMYASDIAQGADIPGFLGFFIAGLFSGSLSSMSSNLNSLATLTFEDVIRRFCKTEIDEKKARYLVRGVAVAYGVITMSIVYVIELSENAIRARSNITNTLGCPLFGVYLLGMFNRRSTPLASLIGLLAGISLGLWLLIDHYEYYSSFGPKLVSVKGCVRYFCNQADPLEPGCRGNYSYVSPSTPPPPTSAPITWNFSFIHRTSYNMGGVFTTLFTFIVGSIVSLFTKQDKTMLEIHQYLAPCLVPKQFETVDTKDAHDEEKI